MHDRLPHRGGPLGELGGGRGGGKGGPQGVAHTLAPIKISMNIFSSAIEAGG